MTALCLPMISYVDPLAAGNAVRLILTPPTGALFSRVLRRTADAFTGAGDSGAVVVADQCTDHAVLDRTGLVNGTAYFWKHYTWDGAAWTAHPTVTGTPSARYADGSVDPQEFLIERLELGLAVEIAAGRVKPQSGKIPVLSAPFAAQDRITLPCISVHLSEDSPAQRGIGDTLGDVVGIGGDWQENEGWLSRVALNVVGVSLNPEERKALRKAIKRIVLANLAVFDAFGMQQVSFTQQDDEALDDERKAAPLFFSNATFDCIAPSVVTEEVDPVTDVQAEALAA